MKTSLLAAVGGVVLSGAAAAVASPVLQFDVNQFSTQATNAQGQNSPFGGLTHTGSVVFSTGIAVLNGIFIQSVPNGPFNNANFSGFSLVQFTGQVNLVNGQVTGGNITLRINNNDQYSCNIAANSGFVSNFVGGGFKIEALTRNGLFSDAQFGNVNVAPWFNAQGTNGLPGSFLQFNFNPNAQGAATSDMDLFVDVVPLPPAAWAGLATLGGAMVARRIKRRNRR
jgi:opacity protein-like surface antigen